MHLRRSIVAVIAGPVVAVLVAGCSSTSEEFPDDTARVEVLDRIHELEVISCGRDEERDVFALGASSADSFLQLLLTIEGEEVDTEASAVSFESRDTGVLGAGDDALLQTEPGAPGVIDVASIRGDRIDVEADLEPLNPADDGVSIPGDARLDLVARCAAVGEVALVDRGPGTFGVPVPTTKGRR